MFPKNAIGDTVWLDSNENGLHDADESGIAGVVVILTGDTNGDGQIDVQRQAVTNSIGKYLFTSLKPGTYTVTVQGLDEYKLTYTLEGVQAGKKSRAGLALGQSRTDLDFGFAEIKVVPESLSIGDTVWLDNNANGSQDGDEKGLAGVTVVLENAKGEVLNSAVTDVDGKYLFTGLASGIYRVNVEAETLPENLTATYDADGELTPHTAQVTLNGASNLDVDFGYVAPVISDKFATYSQGGWSAKPSSTNHTGRLEANFDKIFPNGVVIGEGTTLTFTSAKATRDFLPQGGSAGFLTKSEVNPTKRTGGGEFAGQLLALALNVGASDAGMLPQGLGYLKVTSGHLKGYSVSEVLALSNRVLGGMTAGLPFSIQDLCTIVNQINLNYDNGTVDKGYLAKP
jgi:hypothetical protein